VLKFAVGRIAIAAGSLVGITLITFLVFKLLPGDAALIACNPKADQCDPASLARARHLLGLDRPVWFQYWVFLKSWILLDPVTGGVAWRSFTNTLGLLLGAIVIEVAGGVALGMRAVKREGSLTDRAITLTSLSLVALPVFLLAVVFLQVFTVPWQPYNLTGVFSEDVAPPVFPHMYEPGYWFGHVMLPTLAIAIGGMAVVALVTRSAMAEAMRSNFVLGARARGVAPRGLFWRHGLRAAGAAIVGVVVADLPRLLLADVLVEVIWQWPGIGALTLTAVGERNGPLLASNAIMLCVLVTVLATLGDIAAAAIDPRILAAAGD
jgi:peptide/nickel transport system permease protein